MKQVIIFVFGLLFLITACTTQSKKQEAGPVSGEPDSIQIVEKPYRNSKVIEYEIPILRGTSMKHGIQKRFYTTGSLYSTIPYNHGLKEGVAHTFYRAVAGVKPSVWKEQPYKKNMLDGVCKRYHEDGTLQAEYEYKEGKPGIDLKEFTKSGKAIIQPKLIVSANRTATGYYVSARLSKKAENLDFFIGELDDGKYLPKGLKGLQVKNGLGEIIVEASKKTVTITAVFSTRYRNKCLVSKTIRLQ